MSDESSHILVVDDEPAHRDSLRRIFERAGLQVSVAEEGEQALQILRTERIHVVLTDLVMPRMDGMTLLKAVSTVQPATDIIMMTAYGTVENAVEAMRNGAYDFITKPVKRGEVLACVARVLEKQALVVENQNLKAELQSMRRPDGLIGHSTAIQNLMATLKQVGPSSATVLLFGEAGTGKERCARALHEWSSGSTGPFVSLNCAALPADVLLRELFGEMAGETLKPGRLQQASGGTLFLDEVGALGQAAQIKLLRFLQEGEVEIEGSQTVVKVKVRVIAASPENLKNDVTNGSFREDLYYRLNVISVVVPPLRERREDVPVLAEHFLKRFAEHHQKDVQHIERAALDALCAFHFPGNVRELESALERAVVLSKDQSVHLSDLPLDIQNALRDEDNDEREIISFQVGIRMEQLEAAAIDVTMRHTNEDKQLTAKLLGISIRTLYRRLEERDEKTDVLTAPKSPED
ncbi:MAG: sigma-54-dependent Fis family transcriptional regulator [Deltaproteobacteria bacterium]|nr:sigma-54-dependent Fis family transcriptional regulator [Deltaproteobacteria bacterium]